jgi:hypothetical protein
MTPRLGLVSLFEDVYAVVEMEVVLSSKFETP